MESRKMKKAAVRDFFHQLSPIRLLLLNFTNRLGVWDAATIVRMASIPSSTAITTWESKPEFPVQLEKRALYLDILA